MKKIKEDPGKVVIVHHPPQPDTATTKSQPAGEESKGTAEPQKEDSKEKTTQPNK